MKNINKALRLVLGIWIIGLLVVLGLPVDSWGTGATIQFKDRSSSVFAGFDNFDTSGCIETLVSVNAVNDVFQSPPGPGTPTSLVSLSVFQFDSCTSTVLFCAFRDASLADSDLQVNNIKSATLHTNITVFDCDTGNPLSPDMSINLTWTANGHPIPSNNHHFDQRPFSIFKSDTHSTASPAQASGTVSIGTTNFTPDPTLDAQVNSQMSGFLTVFHLF